MSKDPDHLFFVRVLGPLRIDRRGAGKPLPDQAMRAVLSTLLVHANRPVPSDALIDAAWPHGQAPIRPLDSLDTRISRLRTLLAPEADLTWTTNGCVLHIAAEAIDAVRFERMIEAARWCPPREAISTLDTALGLWRGAALPDLHRDGTGHPESVRLHQLRSRAVEDLAARELETGNVEDAAERLLTLLSAEPLRERACGYVMWALHHLGMTEDAIACYNQLRERLLEDLGESPSIELDETYQASTGCRPSAARTGRVYPPATSFTGRGHELARLSTMVERERVITVTGLGGVGKTRLVAEVLSAIPHAVTVVALSTREPKELLPALTEALGMPAEDDENALTGVVTEYLSDRRRVLVLDHCEHLLTEVRALVRKLRAHCPGVTVLATSRVRLGLGDERVFPLGPLARDGTRDPLTSKAGRLFLDRAHAVRSGFPADEAEADTARAVLRQADCRPLPVELLASRVAGAEWSTPSRWPPDVVEWSYERLTSPQQELLNALTVFDVGLDVEHGARSGIDAQSCAAVVEAAGEAGGALAELAHCGLLTPVDVPRAGRAEREVHYRMPDLVRRIAVRRFHGSDAERKIRERHALWCANLVDTTAGSVAEHGDLDAYERLRRFEGDLCAALRWASEAEPTLAAELTGRIGLLCAFRPRARLSPWQLRVARDPDPRLSRHTLAAASGSEAAMRYGLPEEALRLATRAAELANSLPEHCFALRTLACAHYEFGRDDRAAGVCHELISTPGVPELYAADAHAFLALVAARRAAMEDGVAAVGTARALALRAGSSTRAALATYARGRVSLATDLSEAAATLVAARAEAQAADAGWIAVSAGTDLAGALVRLGRVPEAGKMLQQVLDDWQRMRNVAALRSALDVAFHCLAAAGDRATAESLSRAVTEPDPRTRGESDERRIGRTARACARALATMFGTVRTPAIGARN